MEVLKLSWIRLSSGSTGNEDEAEAKRLFLPLSCRYKDTRLVKRPSHVTGARMNHLLLLVALGLAGLPR